MSLKPSPKPNSREFKALQAKWYKKAAQGGKYVDIEQPDGNLKAWSTSLIRHDEITENAKQDYYRLACQLLHEYEFASPTERRIWELHAEGLSIRNITKELKKKRIKAHKNGVNVVVRRISSEMVNKCNLKKPT